MCLSCQCLYSTLTQRLNQHFYCRPTFYTKQSPGTQHLLAASFFLFSPEAIERPKVSRLSLLKTWRSVSLLIHFIHSQIPRQCCCCAMSVCKLAQVAHPPIGPGGSQVKASLLIGRLESDAVRSVA